MKLKVCLTAEEIAYIEFELYHMERKTVWEWNEIRQKRRVTYFWIQEIVYTL